jgi:hypothetical protein
MSTYSPMYASFLNAVKQTAASKHAYKHRGYVRIREYLEKEAKKYIKLAIIPEMDYQVASNYIANIFQQTEMLRRNCCDIM